ncbi:MAG: hypothetical protein JSU63_01335 [Phycisphaerales bacterium]|nr:MAG: hypothetical protein JSU63_01335 [Phycisphaerales bacterium]
MKVSPQNREGAKEASSEPERFCLACGYNLRGLGDEPRCPECGLLNIPEGLRKQVWDLVDSGKWFFSGMFRPFEKRLPGWWWALDREGDIRRSYKFAAKNVLAAALIVLAASWTAGACVMRITAYYASFDTDNLDGPPVAEATDVSYLGVGLMGIGQTAESEPDWSSLYGRGQSVKQRYATRLMFKPSRDGMILGGGLLLWMVILWCGPAYVGISTQIRKGLPEFARAPRTLTAAANYESHRLVYLSIFIAVCLGIEVSLRRTINLSSPQSFVTYGASLILLLAAMVAFGAAGWVGPLRSDYTKQLVRSRLHAARIILMYAVLLPSLLTFGIISLVQIKGQG